MQCLRQGRYGETLRCTKPSEGLCFLFIEFWKVGPWKDREEIRNIFPWNEGWMFFQSLDVYLLLAKTEL